MIVNSKSKLFFGIVKRETKEEFTVKVFLVNPTDQTFSINQGQGSTQACDEGLIDLGWSYDKNIFTLGPKSSHCIDVMYDAGDLDFTTTYNITVTDEAGEAETIIESVNSWDVYVNTRPAYRFMMESLPIIEKKGVYKRLEYYTEKG